MDAVYVAGEEVSEDFPKEALKWQEDAEPEPAEPAVFEPPAVEPAVEEVAVIPEPASPEPAAAAEPAVAVPEPPVEEALHLEAEPPEAPGEVPNEAVDEAPAAPAEPFEEAPAAPGAEGLPEPNPFGEDAQRLREDLAEAQGLLKQRERGPPACNDHVMTSISGPRPSSDESMILQHCNSYSNRSTIVILYRL